MLGRDLKGAGLKVTVPRVKVLEIFSHSELRHLSADDVYARLREQDMDVGLATVSVCNAGASRNLPMRRLKSCKCRPRSRMVMN